MILQCMMYCRIIINSCQSAATSEIVKHCWAPDWSTLATFLTLPFTLMVHVPFTSQVIFRLHV